MNNNDEIIFWKVIRNIYLFKKILSFLKSEFRYEKYGYDEIKDVKWMIHNKYLLLLKDKVQRNDQDLAFFKCSYYTDRNTNNNNHDSIFQLNEPLKSDYQFYKDLFKNYYNYFIEEQLLGNYDSIDNNNNNNNKFEIKKIKKKQIKNERIEQKRSFLDRLIKFENLIAYSIIIDEFKLHIPTDDDLITSINNYSFEISNYLIFSNGGNEEKVKINKSNNEKIWKSIINESYDKNNNNNNNNNNNSNNNIKNNIIKIIDNSIDLKIDYLINKAKIEIPLKLFKSIEYQINYQVGKSSLKTLLDSCFTIYYLNFKIDYWEKIKNQFSKSGVSTINGYMATDIAVTQYLNEEYYSIPLSQLEIYKKKFQELNILSNNVNDIIDLTDDDDNDKNIVNEMISNLLKMIIPFTGYSFNFLNYLYYLVIFKIKNKNENSIIDNNNNLEYCKFIISREERLLIFSIKSKKFLNKQICILNNMLKNNEKKINNFDILYDYWEDFIHFDSHTELLEILSMKFMKINSSFINSWFDIYFFHKVKSIEMFDYLYSKKNQETINFNRLFYSISLLRHFKEKYPINYEKSLIDYTIIYGYYENDKIQFLIDNYDQFRGKLIEHLKDNGSSLRFYNRDRLDDELILKVVQDPEKLRCFFRERGTVIFKYYFDDTIDISSDRGILVKELCFRRDLKAIDKLLLTKSIPLISKVLLYASGCGAIEIFKFIFNNPKHKWIFNEKVFPDEIQHSNIFNFLLNSNVKCDNIRFIKYIY
ncbi:hypothetical protein DDB_G0290323 [Dictyostelium discoideum AX4]|uniref:Uncharacterized protein n=1 Tax=Dictyostelium discoideum TaxID=44689 RepID=Q54G82_DICDI|nr:hypothetical protein DDB_G0290323 [Dictyostelium discoideum AX4]EAL62288.1 hypothetical protein DDB_G0290323 [Dictyostelium discoideum AX4]|eukprot:XP_635801.1 hypothetical protein DDB_G0290323 [Dictyostelium discoideum AX4]